MQVQVIRYIRTGDNKIETWDYQDKTSHRMVVGKNLQLTVLTMGPKKNSHAILFLARRCPQIKKTQQGLIKRGPLGPRSKSRGTLFWRACDIYIYIEVFARNRYYVHNVHMEQGNKENNVHKHLCTAWTGVDHDLPQYIFGERHYIQLFTGKLVEQIVPLKQFLAMVHPAPPHRLAHTLWGSHLSVLGLQVLKS